MKIRGIPAKQKDILALLLILATAFLIYSNAIQGGFVLEDFNFIANNQYVKDWKYLPQIFTREVGAGSANTYTYYRPTQIFSYLVEYTLWGPKVQGYHVTNIVLHGLIGFLIYRLIFMLFASRVLSLGTALLFIVHPIHNSVVAHIAGRENTLGALFLLISFIVYIRVCKADNVWLYPVFWLIWALALLSKENNIMFPFLLALYHYISKEKMRPGLWIGLMTTLGLYFGLRVMLLTSVPFKAFEVSSVWQRVPGAFVALTKYFNLLICPTQIHQVYDNIVFPFTYPQALLGFVLCAGILGYAYHRRHVDGWLTFAVVWFYILYIPVSNLYPINAYMGEHRIYLASLGYFLIVSKLLYDFYRKEKTRIAAVVIFIFIFMSHGLLTYISNRQWRSHDTFIENNYRMNPNNPVSLNAYGCLKYRRNEIRQAIELFAKTIKSRPTYLDAYINLGAALRKIGKDQQAIQILELAIAIGPPRAAVFHNLATVYSDRKQYEQAEQFYLKAVALNPYEMETYYNLGRMFYITHDFEKAIGYFEKMIELDSHDTRANQYLCRLYLQTGRPELANSYCDKYIHLISPRLNPEEIRIIKERLKEPFELL